MWCRFLCVAAAAGHSYNCHQPLFGFFCVNPMWRACRNGRGSDGLPSLTLCHCHCHHFHHCQYLMPKKKKKKKSTTTTANKNGFLLICIRCAYAGSSSIENWCAMRCACVRGMRVCGSFPFSPANATDISNLWKWWKLKSRKKETLFGVETIGNRSKSSVLLCMCLFSVFHSIRLDWRSEFIVSSLFLLLVVSICCSARINNNTLSSFEWLLEWLNYAVCCLWWFYILITS